LASLLKDFLRPCCCLQQALDCPPKAARVEIGSELRQGSLGRIGPEFDKVGVDGDDLELVVSGAAPLGQNSESAGAKEVGKSSAVSDRILSAAWLPLGPYASPCRFSLYTWPPAALTRLVPWVRRALLSEDRRNRTGPGCRRKRQRQDWCRCRYSPHSARNRARLLNQKEAKALYSMVSTRARP